MAWQRRVIHKYKKKSRPSARPPPPSSGPGFLSCHPLDPIKRNRSVVILCSGVIIDLSSHRISDLALPHSDISLKGISYRLIYHVIYVLVDASFPTDTKSTNEHFPLSLHNTIPQFFRIRHSWFILLTNLKVGKPPNIIKFLF